MDMKISFLVWFGNPFANLMIPKLSADLDHIFEWLLLAFLSHLPVEKLLRLLNPPSFFT